MAIQGETQGATHPRPRLSALIVYAVVLLVLVGSPVVRRWDWGRHQLKDQADLLLVATMAILLLIATARGDWDLSSWTTGTRRSYLTMALVLLAIALIVELSNVENKDKLLVGAVLIGAGVAFAWFVSKSFALEGQTHFLAMVTFPVIFYLLLAGYIKGLNLPGGFELEVAEIADRPARTALGLDLQDWFEFNQQQATTGANPDGAVDSGGYNAIVLSQGDSVQDVNSVQNLLTRDRGIRFLVVLDDQNKLVGFLPADKAIADLASPSAPYFVRQYFQDKQGSATDVFPDLRSETIPGSPTAADALQAMMARNLDAIAIIDSTKGRHFEGIVERGELLSQMVLALSGVPTPTPPASNT